MLLRIYYLYENSPKKLRELKEVYDLLQELCDFDSKGIQPIRALGTRWLAHKSNAIARIIDKFKIYMNHIESIANGKSNYLKEQQAKATGYLQEWKTVRMLINLAVYADILAPLKKLSLVFQKDTVDTVEAADALLEAKRYINRLRLQKVTSFTHVSLIKKKIINNDDGSSSYQNIELNNVDDEISKLEEKKDEELLKLRALLTSRLEENDSDYLDAISLVLNCAAWSSLFEMNESFADESIMMLLNQFETPLRNAGLDCTEVEFIDEWRDLLVYTNKYFSPDTNHYRKTWKRIFLSTQCKKYKNVLLLIELIFCLPVSAAICERSFSLLKRTKQDSRACLGEKRLESLMRISLEGPNTPDFDVTAAVERWASEKPRRPLQTRKLIVEEKSILHSEENTFESDLEI